MWVAPEGFEERTRRHHEGGLALLLADRARKIIITHATRGNIRGRTTTILETLSRHHRLAEATLLLPCDAPHNRRGYAIEIAKAKVDSISEILRPLEKDLIDAARENRVLVAGRFAWRVLSAVSEQVAEALHDKRIIYPCYWLRRPLDPIHQRLKEVLGEHAPDRDVLASYILQAHREALVNRWRRMAPHERLLYRLKLKATYDALPDEEKDRKGSSCVCSIRGAS